ncbi:zinc-binding dehydrogenase [Streptomyces sp. NPDC050485]|uniref:zinc-binding dehydrogenase n=1 Tax=Streptomyces sp. NPDC050485 TaxID=3365617 RepID=UPI0037961E8F
MRTTVSQVREDSAGLNELTKLVDDDSLKVRMHSTFGLQEIQATHTRFLQGGMTGKITVAF